MGQSVICAAEPAPAEPIVSVPVSDVCCDLLKLFAGISDGRVGTGRDHPVAAVLALSAAAVVAGMKGYTAITGWVADVPPAILADLYLRSGAAPVPPLAEDGIPEILAEQRLGHQAPGMRGLYAHASDRMREELKQALQARWQESLKDRAAINEHSPLPVLDQFLAPMRATNDRPADQTTSQQMRQQRPAPDDREKMISQIPPKSADHPSRAASMEGPRRASDLVRHQIRSGGANETRTRDPCLQRACRLWHSVADLALSALQDRL